MMQAIQIWIAASLIGMVLWRLQRLPAWAARHRFPLAISVVSLVLLLGHRFYLSGAGLGFGAHGDTDQFPSGILFNELDNLFYASYATQASADGVYTFLNPHTLQENDRVYVNPVFLLVGKMATVFDVPSYSIMVCLGLLAMCVVIFLTYWNTLHAGFTEQAARWASVFSAFASGLSGPIIELQALSGIPLVPGPGADILFQDALTFSSFYAYPYHTIAYALVSGGILIVLKTENHDFSPSAYLILLSSLTLMAYLIASTHPYEAVMLLASYTLDGTVGVVFYRKSIRQSLLILSALAIGAIPASAMNYWVSQQPVWKGFSDAALALAYPRWFWLSGYGVVLWLAVAGSILSFRRVYYNKGNWLAIWSLTLILLLIGLNVRQTKILSGGYLAFAILAGFTADLIQRWLRKTPSSLLRRLAYAGVIILLPLTFLNSFQLYIFGYSNRAADREVIELASEIKSLTNESPKVLSDEMTSLWLTAYAPVRVYVSHWALTPGYETGLRRVVLAGIRPDDWVDPPNYNRATIDQFVALLQSAAPQFVVLRKDAKAFQFAQQFRDLQELRCLERYCLYRYGAINRRD